MQEDLRKHYIQRLQKSSVRRSAGSGSASLDSKHESRLLKYSAAFANEA